MLGPFFAAAHGQSHCLQSVAGLGLIPKGVILSSNPVVRGTGLCSRPLVPIMISKRAYRVTVVGVWRARRGSLGLALYNFVYLGPNAIR